MNLNGAHWHLLVNHIPIVGSFMAAIVLGYGLFRRNAAIVQLSYGLFVLMAIVTFITSQTGHAAAQYLRSINELDKGLVRAHVQAANWAEMSIYATGLLSFVGLVWAKASTLRYWPVLVLVVALIAFGCMTNTGRLGGLIMHRELRTETVAPAQP